MGLARGDVTPPVGIYHRMWGAATHDRATGVHRPLTATALVFEPLEQATGDGATSDGAISDAASEAVGRQILIAVDHCLLWSPEMEALLTTVSRQAGVDRRQIVVAFSHTHSGGLIGLERVNMPGGDLIPAYLESLAAALAGLVRQACDGLQPGNIVFGAGRCNLAVQRDFWDADSRQFVCGFNPDGPIDDTVLVARIADAGGRTLASVVNYACHPTTLAWQSSLISPDFIGGMREVVERETAAPCLFLQGASGDAAPREGYVGDPAVADRNGRELGFAALAALTALPAAGTRFAYSGPVVSGATLGTWSHVPLDEAQQRAQRRWRVRRWGVELPLRTDRPGKAATLAERDAWRGKEQAAHARGDAAQARDCRAMIERLDRHLTRIATLPDGAQFALPVVLWQTGDALWLAVEGEFYNVFQRSLRKCIPGTPLMVITVANGSRPTYLPPAEVYGKGIYQESIAMLAPGSLETLIDAVSEQINEWCGPDIRAAAGSDKNA